MRFALLLLGVLCLVPWPTIGDESDVLFSVSFDELQLPLTLVDADPTNADGASPPVVAAGVCGRGLFLDGVDDYGFADIADHVGDFTLSMWVKARGLDAAPAALAYRAAFSSFVNLGAGGTPDTFQIQLAADGASLQYRLYTEQAFSAAGYPIGSAVEQWQHLAIRKTAGQVATFLDGQQAGLQDLQPGESMAIRHVLLGTNRGGTRFFPGIIDEVRIWGVGLNDGEIQALYEERLLWRPVFEHAPTPEGPWTADATAQIVEIAPGRYEATTPMTEEVAFFRVVEVAGPGPCCISSIQRAGESLRVEIAGQAADGDGDTVADCEDVCVGYDDLDDSDGDGVPDGCDICLGHDDGADSDGDQVPDGCDVCPGLADYIDQNGNQVPDCLETPPGMSMIPAGEFVMGSWGYTESPPHTVYVSEFFMAQHEVTKSLWDEVHIWALANGYTFGYTGLAKGPDHPITHVSWYDGVKWCNARSEKEGLTPCYYTSAEQTSVYRTDQGGLENDWVKWDADGYRLPTEAEWEKAARGGLEGKRFPWGDTITHSQANYTSSLWFSYDVSPTRHGHPDFRVGEQPLTNPVGFFAPNGYGLYDMAGNVEEWCWDCYFEMWYEDPRASEPDPRGPECTSGRVPRGGSYGGLANLVRCASRGGSSPGQSNETMGFRCARGSSSRVALPVTGAASH